MLSTRLLPATVIAVLVCLTPMVVHAADIHGAVYDATPDWSDAALARFEALFEKALATDAEQRERMDAEIESELIRLHEATARREPMAGVFVTLTGNGVDERVAADADGAYRFRNLPRGTYTVRAEAEVPPPTGVGPERRAVFEKEVEVYFEDQDREVDVELHGEWIVVRGRVTGPDGKPVAGATVRGVPHPLPETHVDSLETVTDAEGSYELAPVRPHPLHRMGTYLMGGGYAEPGIVTPFGITVHVDADGLVQDAEAAPHVVPVSEDVRKAAGRYGAGFMRLVAQARADAGKEPPDLAPRPDSEFPSSTGNIITGVDIVLQTVRDGE